MENNIAWFLAVENGGLDVRTVSGLAAFTKLKTLKQSVLFLILLTFGHPSFSQNVDSVNVSGHLGGAVTVTNNGISFIPTFSLGKPAAIFDLNMGKKRLGFEPQFRFSLEGKPWSFLFWWRYKLIKTNKVSVTLGAHPALSFKTISLKAMPVIGKS